jgi:hypothetical protein
LQFGPGGLRSFQFLGHLVGEQPLIGLRIPDALSVGVALCLDTAVDPYTILLIEQDRRLVMGLCQRIAVLNFGELIAKGLRRRSPCSNIVPPRSAGLIRAS